jgi:branched-chain amino acid transport system substrate-binding protein
MARVLAWSDGVPDSDLELLPDGLGDEPGASVKTSTLQMRGYRITWWKITPGLRRTPGTVGPKGLGTEGNAMTNGRTKRRHATPARWPLLCAAIALALGAPGLSARAAGTVTVGVLLPLTGNFANNGQQALAGIKIYLDRVHGMAGDTKINLVVEDEQGKPDVAVEKARELVERDGAQVLTGVVSSGVALAVNDFSRQNKVPLVLSGDAGADELTMPGPLVNPYLVRTSQNGRILSAVPADWAYKKMGWRKVALIASDYAGGVDIMHGFAQTFCTLGGTVVQVQWPPINTADYAPYLTNLDRNVDAVAVFTPGADGLRFGRQYAEFGLKGKLPVVDISATIVYPPNLPQIGDAVDGMYSSLFYADALKTPANESFVKEFEARMHEVPSNEGPNGFVGIEAIVDAVKAVNGDLGDKAKFVSALRSVRFDSPKGEISLDKYGQVVESMYIRKVEKEGSQYVNVPVATYSHIDQFWPFTEAQFQSFKYTYSQAKGFLTDCSQVLAKK